MKKYGFLIWIIFLLLFSFSYSQNENDCDEILKKEISLDYINTHIEDFFYEFQSVLHCKFDSIDYQIFMGPKGNMPLIAGAIVFLTDSIKQKEKKISYEKIYDLLLKFKKSDEYKQVRKIVIAKNILFNKKATVKEWGKDKELLKQMNFKDEQIEEIFTIVKTNENKDYGEIFKIYSRQIEDKNAHIEKIKEKEFLAKKEENPEIEKYIGDLYAYSDYEVGLKKSKQYKKRTLIYFNAYGCVNSREMESKILLIPEIQNYINDSLIFVNLLVDDRKALNDDEVYFSKVLNKQVKRRGDKNMEIEQKYYQNNFQPFFVLLDEDGKEIGRLGYTLDIEKFKEFINLSLK